MQSCYLAKQHMGSELPDYQLVTVNPKLHYSECFMSSSVGLFAKQAVDSVGTFLAGIR